LSLFLIGGDFFDKRADFCCWLFSLEMLCVKEPKDGVGLRLGRDWGEGGEGGREEEMGGEEAREEVKEVGEEER